MAVLACQGRDKLTLVTSPSIASFGLWVEQLIAESAGKEGQGIIPLTGESPDLFGASPDDNGHERLFVYLRLDGDDNRACDAAIQAVQAAGQPVVRLVLADKYDLGAEFFRWELGTAVAGSYMGINPFDQPNVQQAKDMTEKVLGRFVTTGKRPALDDYGSLQQLLDSAAKGDYLAVMAYVHQTPPVDRALDALRKKIGQKYGIARHCGLRPPLPPLHRPAPQGWSRFRSLPATYHGPTSPTYPSQGPTTPSASWLTPRRPETWKRCWPPTAAPPVSAWAPTRPQASSA